MRMFLVCLSSLLFLAGCPSVAPIPNNVYYIDAPASMGEMGRFIGAWKGVWRGTVGHRLYVQEITPTHANVIVSTGEYFQMGYFDIEKGYKEMQGNIIGKDLFVKIDQEQMKMDITYTMNDNDTISAFGKFLPKGASKPYELKTVLRREKNSRTSGSTERNPTS